MWPGQSVSYWGAGGWGLIGMKTETEDIQLLPNGPTVDSSSHLPSYVIVAVLRGLPLFECSLYFQIDVKQTALCGYFETGYKKNLTVIRLESAPTIHQSAAAWANVLCDRTVPFWLKVAGVGKGYRNATAKRVRLVHCSDSPSSRTPGCTAYARDRLEFASALYLLVFSSSPTSNRSLCLYLNPLGGSWMAFETETASGRRQKKKNNLS